MKLFGQGGEGPRLIAVDSCKFVNSLNEKKTRMSSTKQTKNSVEYKSPKTRGYYITISRNTERKEK